MVFDLVSIHALPRRPESAALIVVGGLNFGFGV
jgi:hypothetical protein